MAEHGEESCLSCDETAEDFGLKHAKAIALANRIGGQVSAISRMMTEDRYCPEILNQIRAARSALRTLESRILEKHLRSCVRDAFASEDDAAKNEKFAEIIDLFRRYES